MLIVLGFGYRWTPYRHGVSAVISRVMTGFMWFKITYAPVEHNPHLEAPDSSGNDCDGEAMTPPAEVPNFVDVCSTRVEYL